MIRCIHCGHASEGGAKFCPACGTKLLAGVALPDGDPLVGIKLTDKYRVLSRLGQGSMGTVYLGEHIGLKKKVALKVLHAALGLTEEVLQRFQREGIAAGKFSHPNAIQIFDFDRVGEGTFFLAMEYVEGRNLKQLLHEEGRLALDDATAVTRQVLGALGAAHAHGIVHRDLKPENVMVSGSPGAFAVKVLDFGLSKLVDVPLEGSLLTEPGRIMGTPLYMPPEQGLGDQVDHRSDLYAVGLILHELLTGQAPFTGETLREILVKHQTQPAPSLVDSHPALKIPGDLDDVVLRALEKDPANRFQSAAEMLAALDAVDPRTAGKRGLHRSRSGTGFTGSRSGATDHVNRPAPARSRAPLLLTALTAALVLGALGAAALWRGANADGRDRDVDVPAPEPRAESWVRVRDKPTDRRTPGDEQYVSRLDEARVALASGNLMDAFAKVSAAFERPELDSEAFALRAAIYAARDDFDMAAADYREALLLDPDYVVARAGLAWLLFERGDRDAARKAFAAIDPDAAESLVGEGVLALHDGDVATARAKLEAAVQQERGHPRAQLHLGRVYLAAGELELAVEALVEAKRADPRSWQARTELGRVYAELGRVEDAERQFGEALGIEPAAHEAFVARAALFAVEGRWSDVLADGAPDLESSRMARLRILRALAHAARAEHARALEEVERGLAQSAGSAHASDVSEDAEVHLLRGTLLQQLGRTDEAVLAYGRALEFDDRLSAAYLNLGLLHFVAERWDAARDALVRAVMTDGDSAQAYYALGLLFMEHFDDPAEARINFEAYLALGGDDARVLGWLKLLGT